MHPHTHTHTPRRGSKSMPPRNFRNFFPEGGQYVVFLADVEQKQLYKAIQIIQNAFRKFKASFTIDSITLHIILCYSCIDTVCVQTQWQQLPRVEDRQKHAALLIENYYTRYRQLKNQQDRAARRIQHSYRMYRNRSQEMNRAALFIQQMYR